MRPRLMGAAAGIACFFAFDPTWAQSRMRTLRLVNPGDVSSLSWTAAAADPKGDGLQARLPDARQVSYAIDQRSDLLWVKVDLFAPAPDTWFGISVAFDIDDAPDNGMTWWGTNKAKFDRLANAFLFKSGDSWQGYFGVGDSDSVARGYMGNLDATVRVAMADDRQALLLGIPRAVFGSGSTTRMLATVGSMLANNDDVPNEGMLTIKLRP